MSLYIFIDPYAVLPDVHVPTHQGEHFTCPACADGMGRTGAFCATCGTALVKEAIVEQSPIDVWDIPNDDERFFTLQDHPKALLYNFKSPHKLTIDRDKQGEVVDLPPFTPEQSIAWLEGEARAVSDWLAAQGHPPLAFRHGVVVGSF